MTSNDKLYLSRREITNTWIDDIRYFMIFEYSFFSFLQKKKEMKNDIIISHHVFVYDCLVLVPSKRER